jgi:hypothetical protein
MGEESVVLDSTQQYVKQIRIEAAVAAGNEEGVQAAQEPTITRKIQELRYAYCWVRVDPPCRADPAMFVARARAVPLRSIAPWEQ